MKHILLVDDDAFFRTMFAGLLPWGDYGYTLLQAENGREAMNMLHARNDISIVFTDMSMPIMDGVELLHYVSEHFPGIHCVALSAYDDFTYVKSSFKSGVDDYLLKHTLTREQLSQILQKYADDVPHAESGTDAAQRGRFLFDFMTGSYSSPMEFEAPFAALSLPVLSKNLLLGVLLADTPDGVFAFCGTSNAAASRLRTALSMLQNLIDRTGTGVAFQGPEDRRIYLLITSSGFENLTFAHQASLTLARQAEGMMLRYFNLRSTLHCSALCRTVSVLRDSYLDMMQEAGQPVILDEPPRGAVIPPPDREMLAEGLRFGTADTLGQLTASYQTGRRLRASAERFIALTRQYLAIITSLCADDELPVPVFPDAVQLASMSDADQEEAVSACLSALHRKMSRRAQEKYTPVVYSSLCMIHQEYGNDQLSLSLISNALHVNPNYLSRLFKARVGQNLSDYLNAQRLRCACRYLTAGELSVKEVSSLCGYNSYSYFFTMFKKRMGMTPKEYRNEALAGRLPLSDAGKEGL